MKYRICFMFMLDWDLWKKFSKFSMIKISFKVKLHDIKFGHFFERKKPLMSLIGSFFGRRKQLMSLMNEN